MRLYPRLHLSHASALASAFDGIDPAVLRAQCPPGVSGQRFAPTGGRRVADSELHSLRRALDGAADAAGFPSRTLTARQVFDRQVAKLLGEARLPPGEMLRAETWAWIAVHLVPHLVQWRFGGTDAITASERFAGSVQRNAIGRLWLRAWVFDRGLEHPGRFDLVDLLTEDASVAILERTTIASDHRLAQRLAEHWLKRREEARTNAEDLLREAAKRIRVLAVVQELAVLEDGEIDSAIDDILDDTAAALEQPSA
jgi:hypothetical protein